MNVTTKPRVVKDFDKLDPAIQQQVKLAYPYGFTENLIYYHDKFGNRISALPFEVEDRYYLMRMTVSQALQIIADDDDYEDGELKEEIKSDYEEKFGEAEVEEDEERDPYKRDEDDVEEDDDQL